jgi:Fe-S-cluster-containing hydrogenase component 2
VFFIIEEKEEKKMLFIRTQFDLCTGCNACQLACSSRATGGYNPHLSRLKILMEGENFLNRPLVCSQCENAFCLRSCSVKAISRNPETGVVLIDKEKCTGCRECIDACPDGMITMDAQGKADKCDLCDGDPLCVRYCVSGALKLVTLITGEEANKDG